MHHRLTRRRAALATLLALAVVGSGQLVIPAAAGPRTEPRIAIDDFMTGLACVESGGRYGAENPSSGAYGKYQIMPRNWTVWAGRYLGDRRAEPTPENQERVARARIERLFDDRGGWRRVAYWWLTGGTETNEARWTTKARGYVEGVMAYAHAAASGDGPHVPGRCRPMDVTPVAPQGERPAGDHVTVKGGSVNVRRGPGFENRLVDVVRRGEVLPVLGRGEDPRGKPWLEVDLGGGRSGWVAGWYMHPVEDG